MQGLGEPLCFVAYGPLATNAFYYAMAAAATHTPTALSAAVMAACVLVRVAPPCMACDIHPIPAASSFTLSRSTAAKVRRVTRSARLSTANRVVANAMRLRCHTRWASPPP